VKPIDKQNRQENQAYIYYILLLYFYKTILYMNPSFTADIECVLENIRLNCVMLTEFHRKNFLKLSQSITYYRIPVLLLSSVASLWSISGTTFLDQHSVSLINCLLGLFASFITSIELFMKLDQQIKLSEDLSHKFYAIGADIFKTLSLKDENREVKGKQYLTEVFSDYIKLVEKSNILDKKLKDQLLPLPIKLERALESSNALALESPHSSDSEGSNFIV